MTAANGLACPQSHHLSQPILDFIITSLVALADLVQPRTIINHLECEDDHKITIKAAVSLFSYLIFYLKHSNLRLVGN